MRTLVLIAINWKCTQNINKNFDKFLKEKIKCCKPQVSWGVQLVFSWGLISEMRTEGWEEVNWELSVGKGKGIAFAKVLRWEGPQTLEELNGQLWWQHIKRDGKVPKRNWRGR